LTLLEQQGIVASDPETGRYRFGRDFLRIAARISARLPLRDVALPHIRDLVESCNETAHLGMYDRGRLEMMIVDTVEADHPLRFVVKQFEWLPLHAGAGGLAILAFLPPAERQKAIQRKPLVPFTERTITDPDELEKELHRIRALGYVLAIGRRVPGAVGVAAPIFGPSDEVVGDVILNLPEARFNPAQESFLASLVVRCARRITEDLGGPHQRVGN
jgi:DNA-binding IclR family transcriptional regulator